VTDDLDNKCRMLDEYARGLRSRLEAQKDWDARHPFANEWDEVEWRAINSFDPRPSTADVLTVERWLAVLELTVAAYREADRG